jgi:glycine oxidase
MVDALVVGGGMMGLLTARELRSLGMEVTLLERDRPGRQASWASAGILGQTAPHLTGPLDVLRESGIRLFPVLAAALEEETGIDVDFVQNGTLVPAFDDQEAAALEAQARDLNAHGAWSEFVTGAALREAEPALGPRVVAARLGEGGNVEVRRLMLALELADLRAGVTIENGVHVVGLVRDANRVVGVRIQDGERRAPVVVLATGSWSGQIEGTEPSIPVIPQRGQILALLPGLDGPRRVVLTPGDPYLAPRVDRRLIVGATREFAGYESRLTAGGLAWLLSAAIELVPPLAEAPIVEQWVGFRPLSIDGVPIIGPAALDGLYYITGHGPTGIGPAPSSVKLLVALIAGTHPPLEAEPYSPLRFGGANMAGQSYLRPGRSALVL